MSMCGCMMGMSPARPTPVPVPPVDSEAESELFRRPAEGTVWADAHAHPGRCFLAGLDDDDPFVRLMGTADLGEALEDIVAGGVGLVCVSTVGDLRALEVGPTGIRATRAFAPGEAAADHRRQLQAIGAWLGGPGWLWVRSAGDLALLGESPQPGGVLACEGADFLDGRIDGVAEAYAFGARSITLVHYRINELGDIQTETPVHGGLTNFGSDVVREMNRLGMVIDLAHATEAVTRDVLDLSSAPVMISHSHLALGPDPHPRLLSREHALSISRSGGLVAAWPSGVALESLDDFVDEILRMVDVLGVGFVAIGTDMAANYKPVMTRHRAYPNLAAELSRRGMADDELAQVLGGNVAALFAAVLRQDDEAC